MNIIRYLRFAKNTRLRQLFTSDFESPVAGPCNARSEKFLLPQDLAAALGAFKINQFAGTKWLVCLPSPETSSQNSPEKWCFGDYFIIFYLCSDPFLFRELLPILKGELLAGALNTPQN